MKKKFDDYTRLAHGGLFSGSLWEGPDHLLYISSSFVGERYRRFDYGKIHAITYGRTRVFGWTLAVHGLLLALFAWGVIANLGGDTFPIAFFGTLCLVFLLFLIVHVAKGPTCVCKIQTAVQVLRLRPLKRIGPSMKCVGRLQELCRLHQGDGPMPTAESIGGSIPSATRAVPGAVKLPFQGSTLLAIALPLMALAGGLQIAGMFMQSMWFFGLNALVTLVAMGLAIAGIARVFRTHLPDALRVSLWGMGGTMIFQLLVALMIYIASIIQQTQRMGDFGSGHFDVLGPWRWMAEAGFEELGVIAWFVIAAGTSAIVFALLGMPTVFQPKMAPLVAATPPPPPPAMGPAANEPPISETPPP